MASCMADTSAWFLSKRRDAPAELRNSFRQMVSRGEVAICGPVQWELLHSTNNAADYSALRQVLMALDHVPFADADWERALDVGQALAEMGSSLHRAPSLPDAIIAVAAERAGLTLLHYDKDFDLIAKVTGQSCEWIAPKGSV